MFENSCIKTCVLTWMFLSNTGPDELTRRSYTPRSWHRLKSSAKYSSMSYLWINTDTPGITRHYITTKQFTVDHTLKFDILNAEKNGRQFAADDFRMHFLWWNILHLYFEKKKTFSLNLGLWGLIRHHFSVIAWCRVGEMSFPELSMTRLALIPILSTVY